jgi:hypothetical protein
MKTISETALKKAIIAAEAERAKHPVALRPDRAELARMRKARQASEKMVGEFVAQAGLDMKQLRAVQEQRNAEIDRLVQRSIYYRNDEGDIEADFESGGFRTWCPVVVFTLLNSPPKVMG